MYCAPMTHDETITLAQNALTLWGAGHVKRLIANRENAVCEAEINGARVAIRLHRIGYQTDAAIRSELIWTDHLAQAGFACPRPVRTLQGDLMGQPAFGPRASVVEWIDAPPIGAMGVTATETAAAQCDLYHALGKLLAKLHKLSDSLDLPVGFERASWDIEGLLGPTPLWGPFWNNPALEDDERTLLLKAKDTAKTILDARHWDVGLIHADVLQENVLGTATALSLIDFDDGGFGLRLYDLGTAMVQHVGTPVAKDMAAALCDGYGGGHKDIELFTLLRGLASCGWVIPRLPPDDPRQRVYAQRAVTLARTFLA